MIKNKKFFLFIKFKIEKNKKLNNLSVSDNKLESNYGSFSQGRLIKRNFTSNVENILDNSAFHGTNINFNTMMNTAKINKKENEMINNSNQNVLCNLNNINSFVINNGESANNPINFSLMPPLKKKYVKKLSFKTEAGKNENGLTKINQDNFVIMENIFNNEDYKIIGVFDGHGN